MLKIIIIAALLKLYMAAENVLLCSVIYGLAITVLNLAHTSEVSPALMGGGIAFLLSTVYFWVLHKLEPFGAIWWLWMFGAGIALILI